MGFLNILREVIQKCSGEEYLFVELLLIALQVRVWAEITLNHMLLPETFY